jgi:hypothetical protein
MLGRKHNGMMYRVYFDGNEGTADGRYGLWLAPSIHDLSLIPGGPRNGMRIVIYMTGEGEMEAILQYDDAWNGWTARPVEGTWKTSDEEV